MAPGFLNLSAFFFFLGEYLGMELLGPWQSCSTFEETIRLLSNVAVLFLCSHQRCVRVSTGAAFWLSAATVDCELGPHWCCVTSAAFNAPVCLVAQQSGIAKQK